MILTQPSKEQWKREVDQAIDRFWINKVEEEAHTKATLKYLNKNLTPDQPHLLWSATANTTRDVRRGTIKAKMLAGVYIVQST